MDRSMLRTALFTIRKRKAEAIRDRKHEQKKIRESCKTSRKRLSEEKRAAEVALRAEFRARRAEDRAQCKRRHAENIQRARTRIEKQRAERKRQLELHKLSQKWDNRSRGAGLTIAKARRAESDDEVRRNLEPDLIPIFDRVNADPKLRRFTKGNRHMSRTEAFLQWALDHADVVATWQADDAENEVDRLIREENRILKELDKLPRGPGGFESLRKRQANWGKKAEGQSPAEAAADSLAEHGSRLTAKEREQIALDIADSIENTGDYGNKLAAKRLHKLKLALLKEAQAQADFERSTGTDDVPF